MQFSSSEIDTNVEAYKFSLHVQIFSYCELERLSTEEERRLQSSDFTLQIIKLQCLVKQPYILRIAGSQISVNLES